MKYCNYCEKEVENWVEVDGDFYCEDCLEKLNDIGYCEDCEEYHYSDRMHWIEDIQASVCDDCYDNNGYFYCEDCGNNYSQDESNLVEHGSRCVCDRCRDNNYVYVNCCDTYIDYDDAYYDEDEDEYYCSSCYNDRGDIVEYHGFSDWHKQRLENENPPYYIGFELEVENTKHSHDNNDLARFAKNTYPIICSRDGSIDYGFEIVSHPLSYNYIVENQDKLKTMLSGLQEKGCESHNPGTCGLHFHVTHPHNDDIIDRIILIMETYKQELIAFSRRTSSQIEEWCKFLSDIKEGEDCKSLYFIKKNKETSTRYMALNLTNYNTIEFRLFRGTLKFDTFMASVELVNNIVTLCSNLDIPIEEITWDRLTETQYAHTYCDVNNIRTTIIPHSNDEYFIEREKKEKQFRESVIKTIEEEIRPLIQHNLIPSDVFTASNMQELDDKFYGYTRTLSSLRDLINIMKTIVYSCEHDTSITTIADKINRARICIIGLDCSIDISKVIEKINEEIKSFLGKESE